jgi:heme-degrading monooxygenase HmoA
MLLHMSNEMVDARWHQSCAQFSMAVARLIYVAVDPAQEQEAERLWKQDCAPLMIQQDGCISEELLKCSDQPGEYISYSEWQDAGAIKRYESSDAHHQIEEHTKRLKVKEPPVTKQYELVA